MVDLYCREYIWRIYYCTYEILYGELPDGMEAWQWNGGWDGSLDGTEA